MNRKGVAVLAVVFVTMFFTMAAAVVTHFLDKKKVDVSVDVQDRTENK